MRPKASFSLWLHITLSRLLSGATVSLHEWPKRPDGPLVWVIADSETESSDGVPMLLRRLCQLEPDINILASITIDDDAILPPGVIRLESIPDDTAPIQILLHHWRPDLIVLTGRQLPVKLVGLAHTQNIPVISVDAVAPSRSSRLVRAALSRLTRISVRTPVTIAQLEQMGARTAGMEVGGILSEPPAPLACSESERASMAKAIGTRPIWFASNISPSELDAVLEAQVNAQRHAHRMLLVLAPHPSCDAVALADALTDTGWNVARRSLEAEPDDETQIFLADDPDEYGLWYRIAPMTYMGGTLTGAEQARSPMEPAALGSAIIHGPLTGAFEKDYARLEEARATRDVNDTATLSEAVIDLMAVDRAAMLAHNAWAITSGGAGAIEALARLVISEMPAPLHQGTPDAHA